MRLSEICIVVFIIVLLSISGWTTYKNHTLGSNTSDYETVCIEGHEYFYASFMAKGFLAVKLDAAGLPVSCK